ncbi:30S ribosomal protein S6 [Paramaledivibacter caminithermalis]|jgi:small subunit ribosomal protein S6|uniref:Small ribosomal subunit protein bS6 n=1 Tax=Paramaledivibacter caminithermalis (strain DSM 15212 / CIP 107654 / DViRD3) TaxID=1121301 RepID=A0A1M6ND26_PARC5|nr:30S ribosomal protein S6 [Paramaledivibacter caminithermalis]SHJ93642.1 SSU ribosomal protein S6P [Paramaledivibacter caminithermalis DSM 15212]
MRKYETLFILRPDLEEEKRNELIEKFKSIIATDGEVEEVNEWGLKKLAYEIKKFKEGYYVLVNFKANQDLPKELERNFRISDDVIRYMVISLEEK